MSSRPKEYPRASAALAGLGLTTQLAVPATDGIPIAKMILGVVSRIVTLAQDIEKRREALHQLAEAARTMGQKIPAVVTNRELSPELEHSLQAVYDVLRSIETLFSKHKAKSGFRKALSYAFTTQKRIDDLSHDLSRATQELLWVAAIETSAQVREDSRYIGEFRRLRDSDVDKLKLITEQTRARSAYILKYYTALVGNTGPVLVVRYLERKTQVSPDGNADDDCLPRDVSACDQLLKQFSTVRNSHPNITRIYGMSRGDELTRFTVLKSGYIPISEVPGRSASIERTWDMIVQVVDALCHLKERGASWKPSISNPVFLDDAGVPMIGLNNDLRQGKTLSQLLEPYVLGKLLDYSFKESCKESRDFADEQEALAIPSGGLSVPGPILEWRCSIPRRLIPSLNEKTCAYLETALASCEDELDMRMETGSVFLRAAAACHKVGPTFYAKYYARAGGQDDRILMCRVEDSDDKLIYLTAWSDVPASVTDEFRKKLGVTLPASASFGKLFISTRDPVDPGSMSFRPYH